MSTCNHPHIEPVALIETRKDGHRYVRADAMSCQQCPTIWEYKEAEDLPHWLWVRMKREGVLPMPRLTPAILEAMKEAMRRRETTLPVTDGTR